MRSVVSVLMPVYNAAAYLPKAVESILAQTFREFEFIIVDDGSSDRSLHLLEQYAKQDARIRLISRANTGIVGALSDGLRETTGALIARMDSDDIAMPQRLQKQVDYLQSNPRCVCVGSRVRLIDPFDSPLRETDHKLQHDEIERELLAGIGWAIVHPAAMMRRDAVVAAGGYRREFQYAEDLDLFLRLAEAGNIANLPDVLLEYRQHFQSVNYTRRVEQLGLKELIVREAYKRRGLSMPVEWNLSNRNVRSPAEQLQTWAWSALKCGNVPVARRHALASLRRGPFSAEAWRIMYCALRGR